MSIYPLSRQLSLYYLLLRVHRLSIYPLSRQLSLYYLLLRVHRLSIYQLSRQLSLYYLLLRVHRWSIYPWSRQLSLYFGFISQYGFSAFMVSVKTAWNSLPLSLQCATTTFSFHTNSRHTHWLSKTDGASDLLYRREFDSPKDFERRRPAA